MSSNHSGFSTGDSCISHFLSITHDILSLICKEFEIFLAISKAFRKICHEGPIYEPLKYGFSSDLLYLLTNFLTNKKQTVVLNDQHLSWADIKTGVPQTSILGIIYIFLYINDLTGNLDSNPMHFTHETFLYSTVNEVTHSNY